MTRRACSASVPGMARALTVLALQHAHVAGDPAATLAAFEAKVRAARKTYRSVDLVMVPELHLSAPPAALDAAPDGWSPEGDASFDVPGPLTERLGALARETGLWLVPGSVWEKGEGGALYNTALVFSPAGELVATYRKAFPWQPFETTTPGRSFTVFDIPEVGRIGLAICYDGTFPETFRQLAWLGAEAVLQPVLTSTADREAEVVCARANAIFNQLHVVSLNAPTPFGHGRTVVVDPEGAVRYEAGSGEEQITVTLDLEQSALARERGSLGINRMLDQLDRLGPELDLPMYGGVGAYVPRPKTR
jgi:formamidase